MSNKKKTMTEIMQDYIKKLRAIQMWEMKYPTNSLFMPDYINFITAEFRVTTDEAVKIYEDYRKWTNKNTVEKETDEKPPVKNNSLVL